MSAFLWIIDFSFSTRLHHGGLLRYFNLSRELVAQGHTVTFGVFFEDQPERSAEWFESLKAEGVLTNYYEIKVDKTLSRWNRLAMLLVAFNLHGLAIRPFIRNTVAEIDSLLKRCAPDCVIVSSRGVIFAAHRVGFAPCIGDFSDSETLRFWRDIRYEVSRGSYKAAASQLPNLLAYFFLELYTCRKYTWNILVSPVDKRLFDRLGDAEKNLVLPNGVRIGSNGSVAKVPRQMIFSGAMNFAPNYEGACWFLDCVFPLVLKALPEATMVIAGGQPDQALLSRAGPNIRVLGFVPDLGHAIAESALYVAPLVTGCGFKNKVMEAIANGTYVIGTTFATEFLEPRVRDLITTRDDPKEMAAAIVEYFSNPAPFQERLDRLRQIAAGEFSWSAKASELARLAGRKP
jgi:glycosyltransferase involved in cell wall biosynthesis